MRALFKPIFWRRVRIALSYLLWVGAGALFLLTLLN
jgi:hypothetical protein